MLILGIDPGPRLHGYALLDVTRARRVRITSGHCDTAEMVARIALHTTRDDGAEIVGVEWSDRILGGFENHQRSRAIARQLIATQGEAGILIGRAGDRVVRIEAARWRRGIVGTSSPTDAMVRAAILRQVEGWPARSSAGAHACDAAGVALAAFNVRSRDGAGLTRDPDPRDQKRGGNATGCASEASAPEVGGRRNTVSKAGACQVRIASAGGRAR